MTSATTRIAKRRLQFTLRHLAIAVLVTSVCLTVYVVWQRSEKRALVERVYKRYEVYQILRTSRHFELFRINKKEPINAAYWQVPDESWISRLGTMSDRRTEELRQVLTATQNFHVPRVMNCVFSPSLRLRAESLGHRLNVYFCFTSDEAFTVQDGKFVGSFSIENVSTELQGLLSGPQLK
jgi:hypothetical protein